LENSGLDLVPGRPVFARVTVAGYGGAAMIAKSLGVAASAILGAVLGVFPAYGQSVVFGQHAFLYSDGTYTELSGPSPGEYTTAVGINNSGQIVGNYLNTGLMASYTAMAPIQLSTFPTLTIHTYLASTIRARLSVFITAQMLIMRGGSYTATERIQL
jgi:hypothetical protein